MSDVDKGFLAGVVGAMLVFILLFLFCGCDSLPQQQRETPVAFWTFEAPESVPALEEIYQRGLSGGYIEQGDEVTLPINWQVFAFLVPRRDVTVPYPFEWAAPGEDWKTLAIATVDSLDSGVALFFVKGTKNGDRVRLNLPSEGYQ